MQSGQNLVHFPRATKAATIQSGMLAYNLSHCFVAKWCLTIVHTCSMGFRSGD